MAVPQCRRQFCVQIFAVLVKEYLEMHNDQASKCRKSRRKIESEGDVLRRASKLPTHQLEAGAYSGFQVMSGVK